MKTSDILNTPEKLVSVVASPDKTDEIRQEQMMAALFMKQILSIPRASANGRNM